MHERTPRVISSRIRRFLQPFMGGLSKGVSRLVGEVFTGMVASGSCLLSEIGRRVQDETTLPHREKRFSRGLDRRGWWQEALHRRVLERGVLHVGREDLIAVDLSDLSKPYARKMEYLDTIRDGSKKTITRGYWLYEAWHLDGSGQPLPLQLFPYSTKHPQFISENQEWLNGLWPLMAALDGKGILMIDRGGDRWKLMKELLKTPQWWIIRQRGDRDLMGPGGARKRVLEWTREALKRKNATQAIRVRLPMSPTPLWLVVAPPLPGGEKPFMLLCRVPWKRNIAKCAVKAYRKRWRCEDAIRATKQGTGLEKFLVRSIRRIERIVLIALLVMRFVAERLLREPSWTKRLIDQDERFPKPIKVYLSSALEAIRRKIAPPRKLAWDPG